MNLFAKACGATGPLQLHVERPGEPAIDRQIFDAPFITVGRDPRADLFLTHRGISRRHAYLQIVSGRLYCLDLGSRMGTYVGNECHQAGWVERLQTLRIGPYRLRLEAGDREPWASSDDDADDGAPRSAEVSHLPRLFLELWDRSHGPSVWQVDRELSLIGTSADCEVRLLDPSTSRYHCSLLRTLAGIWVVDLLGQDGVMVNGTAVRYARVYDGDELHLGNSLIRLHYEMPHPMHSPPALLPGVGPFVLKSSPNGVPETAARAEWTGPGSELMTWPASTAGPMMPLLLAHGPGWIPTGAEPTEQGIELLNSLLFPMVDKFGLMQQQVLDQFQQSMMMMFQSFSSLHDEQMDALRQEFDQLRDLTQELVALRVELAGQTSSSRGQTAGTSPGPAPSQAVANVPSDEPPASARAEGSPEGSERHLATPRGEPATMAVGPARPLVPNPEVPVRHGPESTAAANDLPAAGEDRRKQFAEPADEFGPEMHAWLSRRIMAIQKEQQSSWQRIFSLMPGRTRKKPAS